MKKTWFTSEGSRTFESRDEANDAARRYAFKLQRDVTIYESVAVAQYPLPDIQVVELVSQVSAPAA
jgi:hypothetical protein